MAVRRFSTASISTGAKSSKFWDQATFPSHFESIATVTVGSTSQATVEFNNIPSGYEHLQIRAITRTDRPSTNYDPLWIRFNDDTGTKYSAAHLLADSSTSSVIASNAISLNQIVFYRNAASNSTSGAFAGVVLDVTDYANTSKYKSLRGFLGVDSSVDSTINVQHGFYASTDAIQKITLLSGSGNNFVQYTKFALYGIRGK